MIPCAWALASAISFWCSASSARGLLPVPRRLGELALERLLPRLDGAEDRRPGELLQDQRAAAAKMKTVQSIRPPSTVSGPDGVLFLRRRVDEREVSMDLRRGISFSIETTSGSRLPTPGRATLIAV